MTDTNAAASAADTTQAGPTPGSPEYNDAMAAKYRDAQDPGTQTTPAEPAAKPARPDHVPEKFWDAETGQVRVDDLLKSYTALETGKGKTPDATATDPNAAAGADKEATAAVESAGLNMDTLIAKYDEKGDLEASDYEALAKVGISKEMVAQHVAGNKAIAALAKAEAYSYGGGQEAVDGLIGWAAKSLTPAEITGYNQMLAGPQWKVALDTLKGLKAKTSPTAGEPNLVTTNARAGGSTVGYNTEDEMRADMREPLYREMSPKGEKFRAEVQEKVRLAAYRRSR